MTSKSVWRSRSDVLDAISRAILVSPAYSRRPYPTSADLLHRLIYPGHSLPGFVLPPEDLNQVKLLHGSCRKPHGIGKEMLSSIDTMLEDAAAHPADRPQQLFLTGDQIYGDDVA